MRPTRRLVERLSRAVLPVSAERVPPRNKSRAAVPAAVAIAAAPPI
jgi:hypothetical protein